MAQAKIVELNETNTCQICDNALANYSCPRCNILYCSLPCYQSSKHLECSESFYKECIKKELDVSANDEEAKEKINQILNRMHEKNSIGVIGSQGRPKSDFCSLDHRDFSSDDDVDEDDDDDNLVDRFKDIDLEAQSAEDIWSRLKKDEQQEFLAFLRSGDVSKLIPAWDPWWTYHEEKKKVEEVDNSEKRKYGEGCPKLVKIKDFSKLNAKPPSEHVTYNLINVLASYALMARYFNGEYSEFGKEVVSCLINNSLVLKSNHSFDDFETAVKSVEQECINVDWIQMDAENMTKMKEDVHHILKGPNKSNKKFYVLCALSDIYKLMKESLGKTEDEASSSFAKKLFPEDMPQFKLESDEKIKQCLRKIEYLLSYAKDCFSYD